MERAACIIHGDSVRIRHDITHLVQYSSEPTRDRTSSQSPNPRAGRCGMICDFLTGNLELVGETSRTDRKIRLKLCKVAKIGGEGNEIRVFN